MVGGKVLKPIYWHKRAMFLHIKQHTCRQYNEKKAKKLPLKVLLEICTRLKKIKQKQNVSFMLVMCK